MKKLLATMLVAVVGIAAIAQTVVYDYKATFKRIDPVYKLRTLDPVTVRVPETPPNPVYPKGQYVTESYRVKRDTIYGYVVLPLCTSCGGDMASSLDYAATPTTANQSFAYLARKGDTLTKKKWPGDLVFAPYVIKVPVEAKSAIFKSTVYNVPMTREATPQVKLAKTMDAWMTLDFAIPDTPDAKDANGQPIPDPWIAGNNLPYSLDPGHVIAKAQSSDPRNLLVYGFLGLDHNGGNFEAGLAGYGEGYVVNKGFGKAKVITSSTPGSIGICIGSTGSSYSCNIISSISGSVVGEFLYRGGCGVNPMWDICNVGPTGVDGAPISGTWTLKYNKRMTDKGDTNAQETAIQAKLGWSKATWIDEMPVYESIPE
ncbi:MAG: hypothetical protein GX574_02325 [Lentisphaerae bacterium]|nr:hypothetical protein [Lentisphaerota bacterium]OQC16961.1 MAG: hypothetical protein BWX73_00482 [Lentisphaerae bacterium ADurb.Bin082]HQL86547.1 hypothetical protein [Lentisphaeria bacterium]